MPVFQRYDSFYRLVRQGLCAQPRRPLRLRRRAALADDRGAARGRGPRPRVRRRDDDVSSLLFDVPDARPSSPTTGATSPACAATRTTRRAGWLRTVLGDPGAAPGHPERARRAHDRGAARAGPRRARRRTARRGRSTAGELLTDDPWEWRAVWMQGLAALERGDSPSRAGRVQRRLRPGARRAGAQAGPRPRLRDQAGDDRVAENLYVACARTDATYVAPAAFGLARIRAARGDVDGAVAAYRPRPGRSRASTARRGPALAELLADSNRGLPDLAEAAARRSTTPR